MRGFCSLLLCLGKGSVEVADRHESCHERQSEQVADGHVGVKRTNASGEGPAADTNVQDKDTGLWRRTGGSAEVAKGRHCDSPSDNGQTHTVSASDLLRNERILRALLQKAKLVLTEQSQLYSIGSTSGLSTNLDLHWSKETLTSPELLKLNIQLMETCNSPRPDARTLLRVELLLGDARRWLAARPCPASATAVLYTLGEGLVHAEHVVRSGGQVRFWQPENVGTFLALLQLYADLLVQAARATLLQQRQREQAAKVSQPAQAQVLQQQQQQPRQGQQQLGGGGDDVVVVADDQLLQQPSGQYVESFATALQQGQQPQQLQAQPPRRQHPLTFAAAALLLRPDWLDLLAEALELLHFNAEYRAAAARAGREPPEALAAALQLWSFLTQLVKFAAAHADSVQRMGACLQRLAALLTPPSGAVPRLLALPVAEDTLVAQLHALWLLQVLYDMPDAKVLYSPALADHYVALHHQAMVQYYQASAADPNSASAELCRIHATLLRSLARHPGQPVRNAFARVGTAEWILGEVSLESQLLPAAQGEGGEADDPDGASRSDDDDSDDDDGEDETGIKDLGSRCSSSPSSSSASASASPNGRPAGGSGGARATAAATAASAPGGASGGGDRSFAYTYDLNEDVERLIALEDALGHDLELDGFEYDEEGRQLKARSDALQAEAAAAVAAAATTAAAAGPHHAPSQLSQRQQQDQQQRPRQDAADEATAAAAAAAAAQQAIGFGPRSPSQRSSNVPRLALMGLRSASISSLQAHSPAGVAPRSSGFRRTSHTSSGRGSGPHRCTSTCLEEGDEGSVGDGFGDRDSLDEAPTPKQEDPLVAAAVVERVATWSTSLAEAYAAATASGGDASRLPCPPNHTRSRVSTDAAAVGGGGGGCESAAAGPVRPREVTTGSPIHAGPQGELHIMVPSSSSGRSSQVHGAATAHGRPPLPVKPALPPLKTTSGTGPAAEPGTAGASVPALSPSARAPPLGSSRAMVMLSASNRAHAAWAASPTGSQHPPPPPSQSQSQAQPGNPLSPVRDLSSQFSSFNDAPLSAVAATGGSGDAASGPSSRPALPLIPALNLKSLRRRDGAAPTDTGRTVPLSSMLRTTNAGSLSNHSGMDSANTLLPTSSSIVTASSATAASTSAIALAASSAPPGAGVGSAAASAAALHCIAEISEHSPPELSYQDLACRRLLYQDRATHVLLLKTLMDLLVSPSGALDAAYVPQHPTNSGVPHAEFILLWHLNAPRNNVVVHELCRGAQRSAKQAAAAVAAAAAAAAAAATRRPDSPRLSSAHGGRPPSAASTGSQTVSPKDSARDHPATLRHQQQQQQQQQRAMEDETADATAATAAVMALAPSRASAITCALQLLSRPLFDAGRYTNLQFVARGTFGDVFRARMDPPRAQAWPSPTPPFAVGKLGGAGGAGGSSGGAGGAAAQAAPTQVVIKTIQLPGSAFDSCVLADVFSEVSVMEKFKGHECICQLLDYGMRDDAYWIVMRRYRCSLADWRARQPALGADHATSGSGSGSGASAADGTDAASGPASTGAATAARVLLSALSQIVDALRLLASQHVVHFDLKCSNVLIEPLPGVRDGELWAPVGKLPSLPQAAGAAADAVSESAAAVMGMGAGARDALSVPFRCVLADFGEARAYRCAEEAFTARNRGTEVFKSPEMLLLNAAASGRFSGAAAAAAAAVAAAAATAASTLSTPRQQPQQQPEPLLTPSPSASCQTPPGVLQSGASARPSSGRPPSARVPGSGAARRQQQALAGAGLASDIWSLGCLAFELLSGTVLFGGDYASVTHRVAFGTGEHLTLTAAERARLGNLPQLVGLVEWILARDPARRPSLEQIQDRIARVRAALAVAGP